MQKSCRGKHDKPRSTYGLWHWVGACRLATRCPADGTPASPLFTRLRGGLRWPCSPANGFKPFAHAHERQGQYGVPADGHAQTGSPRGPASPEGTPPGSRPEGPMGFTSLMAPPLRGNARSFLAADAAAVGHGSDPLRADAGEPNSSLSAESDDHLPTPGPYSQTLDSVPRGE